MGTDSTAKLSYTVRTVRTGTQYRLRLVKIVWLAACVAVLMWHFYIAVISREQFTEQQVVDAGTIWVWALSVLTFPSGMLVLMALGGVSLYIGEHVGWQGHGYIETCVAWGLIVMVGYWQWFRVIPRLWKTTSYDAVR